MKKPSVYLKALRLPFISASVITTFIGVALSYVHGKDFNGINALLAVLGVAFLHLGANTINDYFDTDQSDRINAFPTPFSGGSRVVVDRLMSKKEVLSLSLLSFALAGSLGFLLFLRGRPHVLTLGVLGFLCGWAYSAKPFQGMSRGMGEILIFFAFGPLITLGTGYAIEGIFKPEYFFAGFPMGFVVASILWINEFPDYEADAQSKKRNLVVRLGLKRARYGYIALMACFYLSTTALVLTGVYSTFTFFSLLTIPMVVKATKNLWENFSQPLKLIPSQALTIQAHTVGGLLLTAGIFLEKFL